MRRKVEPLLCELHAHTRWSDGALTLPVLVDLYGTNGFDVLAVTDHVVRRDSPWRPPDGLPFGVHVGNHGDYFAEIAAQAERARPRAGASVRLEDAPALREEGGRGGRVPPVARTCVPHPDRRRAAPARSVTAFWNTCARNVRCRP